MVILPKCSDCCNSQMYREADLSTTRTCDVYCNICSMKREPMDGGTTPDREQRVAERLGWAWDRANDIDLCPICNQREKWERLAKVEGVG